MSIESAEAFVKKMREDMEFRESILATKTDEERRAAVEEAGFEFTEDEFKQVREACIEEAKEKGLLSENDLEKVAGGGISCYCFQISCYCFQV